MIKPYYETENGKLYCGDSLDIMREMEDNSVDLVLTDPWYGINHPTNYHQRGRDKLARCNDYLPIIGDNKPFDPSHLLALNIPLILWGGNYYTDKLLPSSGWLIWDKGRPPELDQSTCEMAWSNCIKGVRIFHHRWNGMIRESERGENYHPTQKPIALMEWCLSLRWTPRGTVFDPYCGSGPVPIACERLNRRWIGIEISKEYCDIAISRIQKEVSQLKLGI